MNQDVYAAAGPPVRRSVAGKVLVAINLLLGSVFLGLCVYLAYLGLYFIQPPREVIVPNLVGKQLAQAETLARERKFKVEVVDKQFNDKTPEGTILQMRPEPGRHILEGKPISVWVSSGPKMVEVPDVRDVSFEKARMLLEKAGLKLGDRKSEFDALASRGNVIRQLPDAGENRPRGTRIDLVLSKGPEPLPSYDEPEVIEPTPAPPTPDEEPAAPSADPADDRTSYLTVGYDIPSDAAPHHIRIDVTDKSGTRTVYDELREPGERLSQDVEGTGKKITIKVYDNDVLVSELSGPPFKQ
jgi:beta-lactam-binding protein with PASTA domain